MVGLLAAQGAEGAEHAAAAANWFVRNAWLIPTLPFISTAFTVFLGRRTPGKGPVYGILAVFASFVLAVGVLWSFVQGGGEYERATEWFTVGPLHLELGILVDGLTAVMVVVVTFVSRTEFAVGTTRRP